MGCAVAAGDSDKHSWILVLGCSRGDAAGRLVVPPRSGYRSSTISEWRSPQWAYSHHPPPTYRPPPAGTPPSCPGGNKAPPRGAARRGLTGHVDALSVRALSHPGARAATTTAGITFGGCRWQAARSRRGHPDRASGGIDG